MHLLLDTADTNAWRRHSETGIYRGITTNPLLLKRAGHSCTLETLFGLSDQAAALGFDEIHIQAWGEDLTKCAHEIAGLGQHVIVKLPATVAGFTAAKSLPVQTQVTITAVYGTAQVVAASAINASYAAPYYARLDEAGEDADLILNQMLAIPRPKTRLLVASLRGPDQIVKLAAQGHDCFAVPESVADALLVSDLTSKAVNEFESAAKK